MWGFINHRTKQRHGCLSCINKGLIMLQMLKVHLQLYSHAGGHNTYYLHDDYKMYIISYSMIMIIYLNVFSTFQIQSLK